MRVGVERLVGDPAPVRASASASTPAARRRRRSAPAPRQPGGPHRGQRAAVGRRLDDHRAAGGASARTAVTSAAWPPGQITTSWPPKRPPASRANHARSAATPSTGPRSHAPGAARRGPGRRRAPRSAGAGVEVAGAERERAPGGTASSPRGRSSSLRGTPSATSCQARSARRCGSGAGPERAAARARHHDALARAW